MRAHWGVENRLRRVLDVVFHDDLVRLRTENGPANMAAIRHTAVDLVREIPDEASLEIRRETLGGDDHDLFDAITRPWR